ncbi:MAG: energy transducer TonB [Flavobacteriales bacterium]|nr:hypothetical protein [Flavobacteriales bacterium]MCC6577561.1 energy transducer TonB [Flavobacteriales bacterium]
MWLLLLLAFIAVLPLLLHADGWSNVLSPARNDLVFAGRNQAYGAYRLRRDHPRVLAIAVAITLAVAALIASLPRLLIASREGGARVSGRAIEVELDRYIAAPAGPVAPPATAPRSAGPAARRQGQGFVPIAVDSSAAAPVDTSTTASNSTGTTGSSTDSSSTAGPTGSGGSGGTDGGTGTTGPMGMMAVEELPEYPGGMEALYRDLGRWVDYPEIDRTAGREGRVLVGFVVDEEGRVGEVRVIGGVSRSLDAEAVRVVKRMPKWKPGRHGGKAVSVFYVLPISFKLGRN